MSERTIIYLFALYICLMTMYFVFTGGVRFLVLDLIFLSCFYFMLYWQIEAKRLREEWVNE